MTKHIYTHENINFVNNYQPWVTLVNFDYPVLTLGLLAP